MDYRKRPAMPLDLSDQPENVLENLIFGLSELRLIHRQNGSGANVLKPKRQENEVRLKVIEITFGAQDLLRILVERR
jgi:hypothetical protein